MADSWIIVTDSLDGTERKLLLKEIDNGADPRYSVGVYGTNEGHLSVGNATEANLGADETFEGTYENVTNYAGIRISVATDQASATDGLEIWFAKDADSVGKISDVYTIGAGKFKTYAVTKAGPYMKIRYTNGSTPTTDFAICVIYEKNLSVVSSHRILDSISTEDDAQLVMSVLKAQKPNGLFTNIDATAGGNLKMSGEETDPEFWKNYGSEVALGNILGRKSVNKFGASPDGLQTTPTDIWDLADATPTQQVWLAPTAARIHAIASTSAQDASGGTGALSVIVYGLTDWDTAEVSETVNLTGTTPVNTVNSYVIIHRMKCVAQATTTNVGVNVGKITATAAVDGTVTAAILPSNGQTEMAIYGVPSVQVALLHRWSAQIDKASGLVATADFRIRVNENPDVQTVAFLRKDDISVQSTGSNSIERNYKIPPKFAGPCIIKIEGIASTADVDGESEFDLELVEV